MEIHSERKEGEDRETWISFPTPISRLHGKKFRKQTRKGSFHFLLQILTDAQNSETILQI